METNCRTPLPTGAPATSGGGERWSGVARSADVPRGGKLRVQSLGRELLVFRGADGVAHVCDAYCPHLGADLGVRSKVVGNTVQCAFHGWRFDGEGQCVKVPYCDKIPARAKIRTWPTREKDGLISFRHDMEEDAPPGGHRGAGAAPMERAAPVQLDPRPLGWFAVAFSSDLPLGEDHEGVLATEPYRLRRGRDGGLSFSWAKGGTGLLVEQNGVVLAWHHPQGSAPHFHVPKLPDAGWTLPETKLWHLRSHPQETFEQTVDSAHFTTSHDYGDVEALQPLRCEGPELSVRYQFVRKYPLVVLPNLRVRFETRLYGLGCAHNHAEVPALGLRMRSLLLSTPTEPGRVEHRSVVWLARDGWMGSSRLLAPLICRSVARGVWHDLEQDNPIWDNKRYVAPPVLVATDGPIGAYRRWCTQFYSAAAGREAVAEP